MSKYLAKSWLILLVLSSLLRASSTTADSVLASSFQDDYWIARVQYQVNNYPKPIHITTVLRRTDPVSGYWEEYASLHVRGQQMVAFKDGLALLDDAGKWKLIRSKQVAVDGPSLPDNYRLIVLAADGDLLYGLGLPVQASSTSPASTRSTASDSPALFNLKGNAWKYLCDAPQVGSNVAFSMDVVYGQIFLAYLNNNSIHLDRIVENKWQSVGVINSSSPFKLVNNSPYPLLAVHDTTGSWSINRLPSDQPSTTIPGDPASDLTMVGSTLRMISIDKKDDLNQISITDYGRGKAVGPDHIGQLPIPQPVADVWRQLGLMLMLTVITLMTIKPRSQPMPDAIAKSDLQIAPFSRRVAAGVVDLMPFLLAIYMTMPKQEPSGYFMTQADAVRIAGPTFIGFLVYVLHTMVGEMLFRKSIGKWIFGLTVIAIDGQRATTGSIFVRNLLRFIDIGLGVPWVLIALTPMQQRLGDLAGKTIVVVKKSDLAADDSDEPNH